MLLGHLPVNRRAQRDRVITRSPSVVRAAVETVVACESLECRRLLVTYVIPTATPPHTAAYLTPRGEIGTSLILHPRIQPEVPEDRGEREEPDGFRRR